jgi:dipeptidyl-peptidase-4
MADTFPRQHARTRRFSLGMPRSFTISPDGRQVAFLRTKSGSDPTTCLWLLDVTAGTERLIADPDEIRSGTELLDPAEKARRERARESSSGIVGFAADRALTQAVFVLSGQLYLARLDHAGDDAIQEVATAGPAAEPRLDPAGRRVAYTCAGALRVTDLETGGDLLVAGPDDGETGVFYGRAEFIAAEEMGRMRGYWWSPDGQALLVARVDESMVQQWHIADPAHPELAPTAVRYPAAGTPNAVVSLLVATLERDQAGLTTVDWDREAFPYLVTAHWTGPDQDGAGAGAGSGAGSGAGPMIVVQTRDQREQRLLGVDPGTGQTTLIRAETDPQWTDVVPGIPASTGDGRIVWCTDAEDTRRLLVATAAQLADGSAEPVTPAGLQVREVVDTDGDTVVFLASTEPTEIGLWAYGPDGLALVADPGQPAVQSGRRSGGTTVVVTRNLTATGADAAVLRDGSGAVRIASRAEAPLVPDPEPDIFGAGPTGIRTAVLLPSWHQPGSGPLPVLLDPYGGPHAQRVLAARPAFLASQWLAEQGFAVIVADGRGTPARGPQWERTISRDVAGPVLADQVTALTEAARRHPDLDLSRVGIRGWSFGGFLAALAVLRRPDVFHAAVAGAPPTDWRLYDTHYTERYLGTPGQDPETYEQISLLGDAGRLTRPLMLIHGLVDDNVVVANTLRLSAALLAAGKPHTVLPLSGVTHMASQEEVAENLLLLQVSFLRDALGGPWPTPPEGD